ncbi:MAG: homoserine dehydrogenase [Anaerolineae bacterium]|nr:homoserine dehydrogenase [Anaerolineae bacterium]
MRIALIGFGNVGQGVAQLLRDHGAAYRAQSGADIRITAVVTRSRGSLFRPDGLDPAALLTAMAAGGLAHYPEQAGLQRTVDLYQLGVGADVDVWVEATPSDLTNADEALGRCMRAANHKKHIVTANKGMLVLGYRALMDWASEVGSRVLFEATVMAGTPSIRLAQEALAGCTIQRVRGIVNGTTNYMLTEMEAGRTYDEALAEAQRLGYAETDPTADVDGLDAAYKLVILSNALFGKAPPLAQMSVSGIRGLTNADIAQAAAEGMRWKLIAEATPEGASVGLMKLPLTHPLASVSGSQNAITYTTDLLGDVTLVGVGAGGLPTGYGIVSDLLGLHRLGLA